MITNLLSEGKQNMALSPGCVNKNVIKSTRSNVILKMRCMGSFFDIRIPISAYLMEREDSLQKYVGQYEIP